jgi:hypothetical protein
LFEAYLSVCEWVQVYYLWRPHLRDEADNHAFELAGAGGAATIVTNNVLSRHSDCEAKRNNGDHEMSTLTIRIPESKHARLRNLARARGISINRLMDELATVAIVEHDSKARFRALAAKGSKEVGLALLGKLDRGIRYTPVKHCGVAIEKPLPLQFLQQRVRSLGAVDVR